MSYFKKRIDRGYSLIERIEKRIKKEIKNTDLIHASMNDKKRKG